MIEVSSVLDNMIKDNLVDEDTSTMYHSLATQASDPPPWIRINFAKPVYVDVVRLINWLASMISV